jgi:hypothetical protein
MRCVLVGCVGEYAICAPPPPGAWVSLARCPPQFEIGVGQVIQGWDVGMASMTVGEKSILTIAPEYGYGTWRGTRSRGCLGCALGVGRVCEEGGGAGHG